MGPLEMMYSWQAMLCAVACVGITQLVKAIIDTVYDMRWKRLDEETKRVIGDSLPPPPGPGPHPKSEKADKMGQRVRKQSLLVTRFALPMTPIIIGAIYAMLVPLRPETLIEFVASQEIAGGWALVAYAAWGSASGQFSNYVYDRVKKTLGDMRGKALAK